MPTGNDVHRAQCHRETTTSYSLKKPIDCASVGVESMIIWRISAEWNSGNLDDKEGVTMRSRTDFERGQAEGDSRPSISEVLAEYLSAEKRRLSPRTYARYEDVIRLFSHSLNRYAANSLNKAERELFEETTGAEADRPREFCDVFGPEHILGNVGEFLNYFMVRKAVGDAATLQASGSVIKKLSKWLVEKGYANSEDADLAIQQGSDAARDLPAAAKLTALLYDPTAKHQTPRESDIEGHFSITKIESDRIWVEDEDDGKHYGPILLPEKAIKLCRVGWVISGAVRSTSSRYILVEAYQVLP